ncbi:MAG: vitamin B12 dependent methionine synthase, activation domain protein [Oscillospiraceae bacterium]|nr:vitamin B12 dependent methionine synthase, activation domain protein [Oscillospiraceae bacterium]
MEARLTGIDRRETLQYLGYLGSPIPAELEAEIARCEGEILRTARPRAHWRLYGLLPDGSLEGTTFTPQGQDVPELLKDCSRVILMAATLGSEAEQLLRRSQVRDMSDAVILDAAASAAIENVCDNLCEDLAARFAPAYLTDRFSPGYGDFPFAQQREFFDVLDITRQIGVSLSESGLMLPQKSVTALIGVADRPQEHRHRGCPSCTLFETCRFRKEGKTCGAF